MELALGLILVIVIVVVLVMIASRLGKVGLTKEQRGERKSIGIVLGRDLTIGLPRCWRRW